jgi:heme oxygenase
MGLREATAELHSKAEKMEFNQRMFRGELSKKEYLHYLIQQASIFQCIEEHKSADIGPDLARLTKIFQDIVELSKEVHDTFPTIQATMEYGIYLEGLKTKDLYPHIYLNYMALMYGGQMMKSKVPGKGRMYDFDNVQESIAMIRGIQKDEWASEVNKGFQYIINILDELQTNAG